MKLLALLAAALSLVGRHGTLVVAASLFVGLAVPGLAAACKPLLGPTIVVLLTLAFLRVEPAELRLHWRRPGLIAAATVWLMLVVPALLGLLFLALGVNARLPGLYFMLVLQMSAPGLMSSPALAALMGLDVALTLAEPDRLHRGHAAHRQPVQPCLSRAFARLAVRLRPAPVPLSSPARRSPPPSSAASPGAQRVEAQRLADRRLERARHVPVRGRRHGRRHRACPRRAAAGRRPVAALVRAGARPDRGDRAGVRARRDAAAPSPSA